MIEAPVHGFLDAIPRVRPARGYNRRHNSKTIDLLLIGGDSGDGLETSKSDRLASDSARDLGRDRVVCAVSAPRRGVGREV